MVKLGIVLLLPAMAWWLWWLHTPPPPPPGKLSRGMPVQTDLSASMPEIRLAGWTLKPLAVFSVEARVLGKAKYTDDLTAKIAPYDLALGWGPMSDTTVLEKLEITQGSRFYHWRYWGSSPIPEKDITRNSANMHLLPANDSVLDQIAAFRKGSLVRISGYLVEASHPSGNRPWRSSLTREDSGSGACEIVYVTSAMELRR